MKRTKAFAYLLVGVHAVLGLWALVGFAEWFWPATPWGRLSNPLFPPSVLFMQWVLTLTAASIFILGFARGWEYTPVAMSGVYAAMASLCAVETFAYLEGDFRFVAMGLEYLAYGVILVFLFRSRLFRPDPASMSVLSVPRAMG